MIGNNCLPPNNSDPKDSILPCSRGAEFIFYNSLANLISPWLPELPWAFYKEADALFSAAPPQFLRLFFNYIFIYEQRYRSRSTDFLTAFYGGKLLCRVDTITSPSILMASKSSVSILSRPSYWALKITLPSLTGPEFKPSPATMFSALQQLRSRADNLPCSPTHRYALSPWKSIRDIFFSDNISFFWTFDP